MTSTILSHAAAFFLGWFFGRDAGRNDPKVVLREYYDEQRKTHEKELVAQKRETAKEHVHYINYRSKIEGAFKVKV